MRCAPCFCWGSSRYRPASSWPLSSTGGAPPSSNCQPPRPPLPAAHMPAAPASKPGKTGEPPPPARPKPAPPAAKPPSMNGGGVENPGPPKGGRSSNPLPPEASPGSSNVLQLESRMRSPHPNGSQSRRITGNGIAQAESERYSRSSAAARSGCEYTILFWRGEETASLKEICEDFVLRASAPGGPDRAILPVLRSVRTEDVSRSERESRSKSLVPS
jgi:hypothetical protein